MATNRIDCHQHFWRLNRGDYGWLTESLGPIYRDFEPQDLQPLLVANGIDKTVVIQAAATVAETEYLLELAEKTPFIAGVVGWLDMEATDAVETLTRLAANPYLKGIRPMIQDIVDPQWMLSSTLDPVFQYLIEHHLCFDALIKPQHLPHLLTLLTRYPQLKTVIDHGAKPDIANEDYHQWAHNIFVIATTTTAYCKLSGLITEAKADAGLNELRPYMQHLLDSFGVDRLMWGSDWPVLNLANDYTNWLTITKTLLSQLSESQQTHVMGNNAVYFYNLPRCSSND